MCYQYCVTFVVVAMGLSLLYVTVVECVRAVLCVVSVLDCGFDGLKRKVLFVLFECGDGCIQ